jgi:hypothetical protein
MFMAFSFLLRIRFWISASHQFYQKGALIARVFTVFFNFHEFSVCEEGLCVSLVKEIQDIAMEHDMNGHSKISLESACE